GRPTSYWKGELSQWGKQWVPLPEYGNNDDPTYTARHSHWDSFVERVSGGTRPEHIWGGMEQQLVDPAATPVLLDLLRDPNPDVQAIAALCLGKVGPPASAAFPALLDLFDRLMTAPEPPAPASVEEYRHNREYAACSREVGRALRRIDREEAERHQVARRRGA